MLTAVLYVTSAAMFSWYVVAVAAAVAVVVVVDEGLRVRVGLPPHSPVLLAMTGVAVVMGEEEEAAGAVCTSHPLS
jgi:TRAP-type uncharacterized transport system fused permease subunit